MFTSNYTAVKSFKNPRIYIFAENFNRLSSLWVDHEIPRIYIFAENFNRLSSLWVDHEIQPTALQRTSHPSSKHLAKFGTYS